MRTAATAPNRPMKDRNPSPPSHGAPPFFHRVFERWARKRPRAPAIIDSGGTVTYAELDRLSNRLARHLQALGAGPEVPVALCFERSREFVTGVVGIAKAGAACAYLDPGYPPLRLVSMIREAGARLLVTTDSVARALPGHGATVVAVDRDRNAIASWSDGGVEDGLLAGNLSSIFFTSGSTGIPKAVMWQYPRGVIPERRRFFQRLRPAPPRPGERHLFKASVGFTLVTREVQTPLRTGGAVVIVPPGGEQDPRQIVDAMIRHRVVSITAVPTLLDLLLKEPDLSRCRRLRDVISFGEKLSPGLAADLLSKSRARLTVVYGATEAPSATTATLSRRHPTAPLSIGRVNPGRRIYLLDSDLQPVAPGSVGEIFIGGTISRGYAGRPALTAERYLPDPFSPHPGSRMYRTGDLGRLSEEGTLEFSGRADEQVKIRGFRVELSEIEAALRDHPGISSAVAVAHRLSGEDPTLVAYYLPADPAGPLPDEAGLIRFLRSRLPSFMVPSRIVSVPAFPVNRNGKIDRSSFPVPSGRLPGPERPPDPPVTPTESVLCRIWERVLSRSPIGRSDDFFDLGGHSIQAARIAAESRGAFQVDLSVTELFNHPSVAALASEIDRQRAQAGLREELLPAILPSCSLHPEAPAPTTSFQRSCFKENERTRAGGLPSNNGLLHFALRGPVEPGALREALREIVRRHHILRTTYQRTGKTLLQAVQAPGAFQIEDLDASSGSSGERSELPLSVHRSYRSRHFDLSREIPLRATLIRLGPDEFRLILALHHIAYDQVTTRLFLRELWELHRAYSGKEPSPLAEPALQYADYAAWEAGWLRPDSVRYQRLSAYWLRQLSGAPASPESILHAAVPTPHPPREDAIHPIELAPETISQLRACARARRTTLFMVLLSAIKAAFHLASGESDLILTTFVDARIRPELNDLFGCFTRGLPLRTSVDSDLTFAQLLARVRSVCLEAFAHLDLPSDKIGDTLRKSGNPPLQIRAAVQILEVGEQAPVPAPPGIAIEPIHDGPAFRIGSTDFFIQFVDFGDRLSGTLYSGSGRCCPERLRRFARAVAGILALVPDQPDAPLSRFAPLVHDGVAAAPWKRLPAPGS